MPALGGTNKLLLDSDPIPDSPALNCLAVCVNESLNPELSTLPKSINGIITYQGKYACI